MTQSAPALIEVDKIDIEEGFNARSHMDEEGLEGLAASLAEAGVAPPCGFSSRTGAGAGRG